MKDNRKQVYYKDQSSAEQVDTIRKIASYIKEDLPYLISCGRKFDSRAVDTFNRGIDLLCLFPNYVSFSSEARQCRPAYDQYTNRMKFLFEILSKELASEMQTHDKDGKPVITLAVEGEDVSRRAEALAEMTGAKIVRVEEPADVSSGSEEMSASADPAATTTDIGTSSRRRKKKMK